MYYPNTFSIMQKLTIFITFRNFGMPWLKCGHFCHQNGSRYFGIFQNFNPLDTQISDSTVKNVSPKKIFAVRRNQIRTQC